MLLKSLSTQMGSLQIRNIWRCLWKHLAFHWEGLQ